MLDTEGDCCTFGQVELPEQVLGTPIVDPDQHALAGSGAMDY